MADSRANGNRIDSFCDRKSVDHAFTIDLPPIALIAVIVHAAPAQDSWRFVSDSQLLL
jgi:hypothetical protein